LKECLPDFEGTIVVVCCCCSKDASDYQWLGSGAFTSLTLSSFVWFPGLKYFLPMGYHDYHFH